MVILEPNDEKLAELILYISKLCEEDRKFGATKLNKILFYSDFLSYVEFGHAITNHDYQAIRQGPAPKQLLPIRDRLIREGALAIQEADYFGRTQKRTVALRSPRLDLFSAGEIDVVNKIVRALCDCNGTDVSELSHKFLGWELAEDREVIPYEVALLSRREPTEEEIAYGESLADFAKVCVGKRYGDN